MALYIFQINTDSPLGPLEIFSTRIGLCALRFANDVRSRNQILPKIFRNKPLKKGDPFQAEPAFQDWLSGEHSSFISIPLDIHGTPFQAQVWSALQTIPWGETWSYGELARQIGRPNAARAIGAACGANPVPIVVPCHRVVGSNGKLIGFSCGLDRKKWLLDFEQLQP